MKTWWAGSELVGLPGLPQHPVHVRKMAGRQGWVSRPRAGRGGGVEYSFSSLPLETRRHLCIVAGEPEPTDTDSSPPAPAGLSVDPQPGVAGLSSALQVAELEAIRDEAPVPPVETQLSGADIPLSCRWLRKPADSWRIARAVANEGGEDRSGRWGT